MSKSKSDRLLEAMALLGAFIELSDRVANSNGALDMQGNLLALNSSIQKNKPRLIKWANEVRAEYKDAMNGT